jgi:hypothetical protein
VDPRQIEDAAAAVLVLTDRARREVSGPLNDPVTLRAFALSRAAEFGIWLDQLKHPIR